MCGVWCTYCTVSNSALLYSVELYGAVSYSVVQCCAVLFRIALCHTVLLSMILKWKAVYSATMVNTVHCTTPY